MWIPPYHRDQIPDGLDNSGFGEECAHVSLFSRDLEAPVAVHSNFDGPFKFPASVVLGDDPLSLKNVYSSCQATFESAISEPLQTTIFPPDHALFLDVNDQPHLLQESLWHSEIFFSNWVRCDRTTDWKYRANWGFQSLKVNGIVANAYHRYSFQYFHWLFDTLPRIWLLSGRAEVKGAKWFVGNLTQPFQAECLKIFGVNPADLITVPDTTPVSFESAFNVGFRFRESLGTLRPDFSSGIYNVGWSEEYIQTLRQLAFRACGELSGSRYGERILITRPDAAHRRIVNDAEVRNVATKYGFLEFCPGTHSFLEQVKVFSSAKVILGIHGAGLSNLVWSSAGGRVGELMPGGLDDVGYRFLSNIARLDHFVLKCDQLPHPLGVAYADIKVDIDNLDHMLRQMVE